MENFEVKNSTSKTITEISSSAQQHINPQSLPDTEFFDMSENADYELVYEKHDWCNIKDFINEFYNIENGKEYALLVSVNESKKAYSTAFVSTLMGLILTKNPDKNCGFTCNIEKSKDNKNHFRVFKIKG